MKLRLRILTALAVALFTGNQTFAMGINCLKEQALAIVQNNGATIQSLDSFVMLNDFLIARQFDDMYTKRLAYESNPRQNEGSWRTYLSNLAKKILNNPDTIQPYAQHAFNPSLKKFVQTNDPAGYRQCITTQAGSSRPSVAAQAGPSRPSMQPIRFDSSNTSSSSSTRASSSSSEDEQTWSLNLNNNVTLNPRNDIFNRRFTTPFNPGRPATVRNIIKNNIIYRVLGQPQYAALLQRYPKGNKTTEVLVSSNERHLHLTLFDFGTITSAQRTCAENAIGQTLQTHNRTNPGNIDLNPRNSSLTMVPGRKKGKYYIYIDSRQQREINTFTARLQRELSSKLRNDCGIADLPEQIEPHVTLFTLSLPLPDNTEREIAAYRAAFLEVMNAIDNRDPQRRTILQLITALLTEVSQHVNAAGSLGTIDFENSYLRNRTVEAGRINVTDVQLFDRNGNPQMGRQRAERGRRSRSSSRGRGCRRTEQQRCPQS